MMDNSKTRDGFFKLYFANFKTMFLGNLFFSLPLLLAGGVVYGMALLTKQSDNMWFLGLVIPLIYPFFAGITQITKDVVKIHTKPVSAWLSFKKGLKNNAQYFVLYGILIYVTFIISYYSLIFYYKMALMDKIFYVPLFVAVLITLFLLFMTFSLPILTVTMKLELRYYFKNSALMAIGELPMNFYILITTCVLISACFTLSMMTPYPVLGISIMIFSFFLLLPTGISYCSVYRLYPKIEDVFDLTEKEKSKEFPLKPIAVVPTDDDGNPIDLNNNTTSDGYVFVNGMMIKKSQTKNNT